MGVDLLALFSRGIWKHDTGVTIEDTIMPFEVKAESDVFDVRIDFVEESA
jgi:hypothetical protein